MQVGLPDKPMEDYIYLMDEVKLRLSAMKGMLEEVYVADVESPRFIIAESCYLQLRLICETIAIAAVALHQDRVSGGVHKNYEPHKIFDQLIKMNSDAFPRAVTLNSVGEKFDFAFSPERNLLPRGLNQIWAACGNALHRGTFKNISSGKQLPYDMPFLETSMLKIANFLNQHTILLDGDEEVCVIEMERDGNGVTIHRGFLNKKVRILM